MRHVGAYDIDDPTKIQGRDEVFVSDRSLAALRLRHALDALTDVNGEVLVLGCGAGRYVRAIQRERPDLRLHAGDLSISALREARARDIHALYAALDASLLPYRNSAFGGVVFFDLLEHVPEYQRMLREIARVLAPGGVLYFFVPLEGKGGTVYSILRDSRRLPIRRWKRDHVGHVNRFTPEEVQRDVERAGLSIVAVAYGFHLAGQVHDVVDYWQRERKAGGPGILPPGAVSLIARLAFIPTWRLSYVEDRLYAGPRLASGLHLTARLPK